jgi:hypothetical protein
MQTRDNINIEDEIHGTLGNLVYGEETCENKTTNLPLNLTVSTNWRGIELIHCLAGRSVCLILSSVVCACVLSSTSTYYLLPEFQEFSLTFSIADKFMN